MGESKATRRIRRIMTQLRMEGKLDRPYYPNGQRNTVQSKVADNRRRCRNCRRWPDFAGLVDGRCSRCRGTQDESLPLARLQSSASSYDCCVGSLSRLPDGVVSCPDCPLDSGTG